MKELKEGAAAPKFPQLTAHLGKTVVVYFYPKDDTPGCTAEAAQFRDDYPRITRQGAVVLGVSPDSVLSHARFTAKLGLPFELVADESHQLCLAYGVWKEKLMYGRKYLGVERTTFIVGLDGRITKIFRKVKPAGHIKEVLAEL